MSLPKRDWIVRLVCWLSPSFRQKVEAMEKGVAAINAPSTFGNHDDSLNPSLARRDAVTRSRSYVTKRPDSSLYEFQRRIPKNLKGRDTRRVYKISLGTRNYDYAISLAADVNIALERYWGALLLGVDPALALRQFDLDVEKAKGRRFTDQVING